jgi:hypothetical protein
MMPAQQRLEIADLVGLQIDQGLIVEVELAIGEGLAVMARRRIDRREGQRIGIVEPHRHRVVVEQKAKRLLTMLNLGDIGQGRRDKVARRPQRSRLGESRHPDRYR